MVVVFHQMGSPSTRTTSQKERTTKVRLRVSNGVSGGGCLGGWAGESAAASTGAATAAAAAAVAAARVSSDAMVPVGLSWSSVVGAIAIGGASTERGGGAGRTQVGAQLLDAGGGGGDGGDGEGARRVVSSGVRMPAAKGMGRPGFSRLP